MRVGILAVQGGFAAHRQALTALGHETCPVRYPQELAAVGGLVLPGGESSTQLALIERSGLRPALDELFGRGCPVLATCAGLILAAATVSGAEQRCLGWLDIDVDRNGWGRQLHSFEAVSDRYHLPLVFIRAPRIAAVGPQVEVLDTLDGEPILVRQQGVVGATFHPELTDAAAVARIAFRA